MIYINFAKLFKFNQLNMNYFLNVSEFQSEII